MLKEDDLPKEELEESLKPSNLRRIPIHLKGEIQQVIKALTKVGPLTSIAIATRHIAVVVVNKRAT